VRQVQGIVTRSALPQKANPMGLVDQPNAGSCACAGHESSAHARVRVCGGAVTRGGQRRKGKSRHPCGGLRRGGSRERGLERARTSSSKPTQSPWYHSSHSSHAIMKSPRRYPLRQMQNTSSSYLSGALHARTLRRMASPPSIRPARRRGKSTSEPHTAPARREAQSARGEGTPRHPSHAPNTCRVQSPGYE
jgi:hypothetical protein